MRRKSLNIILCILIAFIASSCSISKHVPEGKYLIRRNDISFENKHPEVGKSDLSPYVAAEPSWRAITPNFSLWAYYVSEDKKDKKFWKWLHEKVGRVPTYYDKTESDNASKQMEMYLNHVGFFNSKVDNDVEKQEFRAIVKYKVTLSQPYTINSFESQINDTAVAHYVKRIENDYPVKVGDIYDEYKLNKIRDQITEQLRNRGYYYFVRDYITYEVDSNYNNHTLAVTMKIADFLDPNDGTLKPHKQFKINRIDIYPDYSNITHGAIDTIIDSLYTETGRSKQPNMLHFHYPTKPYIKPQTFSQAIQIRAGSNYSLRRISSTYSALGNFKAFGSPSITFEEVKGTPDSVHLLNCRITMQKADQHSYTLNLEGTRAESDLGVKGGISYYNKNLFRRAEMLQISVRGGVEFQSTRNFYTLDTTGTFSTKELGVTANLVFPRFLSPIRFKDFAYNYQPKTTISVGYNWQKRFYYSRHIFSTSFGYDWKSNTNIQHVLTPININMVKITNMQDIFKLILMFDTNQRRKDQYTDHLLLGARYSLTYNSQNIRKGGSFVYLRADLETSGNLLSLFNKTTLITHEDNHYKLFGIRYAQFVRANIDCRQHISLGSDQWLVLREVIGLGVPYGNSYDMPFERSFYAGGANGMRGWNYRGLGPGAYEMTSNDVEQIGDMQLEFNAEYRFPIYSVLNGCVFADAGNVWTYHPNTALPNGEFKFNTFYKQFAIDAGIGLRVDISFVVIRVDLAMPMRNPYPNAAGDNWRFRDMKFKDLHLQIGIGYPF